MHPEHRIVIETKPVDIERFLSLRDAIATTPFGGAAMLVMALLAAVDDLPLGLQCLTAILDPSHITPGSRGLQGHEPSSVVLRNIHDRLSTKPWIVRSYFERTSPAQSYVLPELPWSIRVREQTRDVGPADAKVFVFSTGADTPRPVRLIRSPKGIWKAKEWSSLEVGVRAPAAVTPDI